ncbi:hypothetical protein BKA65DRAFT_556012 [Rhexocercosporidium sp. MPI-PUGE-AT-0058]|nr:hypothetical protein BKA65DRAFT_556012 [Rhexocercosporidium sp. MPI-PUGE-AT-0058]
MTDFSRPNVAQLPGFRDIELGNLTPRGVARAPAAVVAPSPNTNPLPQQPEKKKNIVRRKCLDPMKVFCEKYPNWSIVIFIFLVVFCMFMCTLLLTLSMEVFAGNNPLTDEMRDGIEHLPGFNKGIYR